MKDAAPLSDFPVTALFHLMDLFLLLLVLLFLLMDHRQETSNAFINGSPPRAMDRHETP